MNKLLNSDMVDIALKAHGYGLFVHNWGGNSTNSTTGVEGIIFTPDSVASQGISIRRSNTEIVLMNTKGGTFTYSGALGIDSASRGYFDDNDNWVNQGSVPFNNTSITPDAGTTVLLTRPDAGEITQSISLQAEFASYGGGMSVGSSNVGFAGNGYVDFNANGAYVQWGKVDGLTGGNRVIRFRFANGDTASKTVSLIINGTSQNITFPSTGSWDNYQLLSLTVPLNSGPNNTIRVESAGQDSGNIDELQLL